LVETDENRVEDENHDITLQANIVNAPLFAQDDDLGPMSSLHLPCKSKSDIRGHQRTQHLEQARGGYNSKATLDGYNSSFNVAPSSIYKIPLGSPQQLFGSPEETIRSHSSYSRIHGQPKRLHASSSSENVHVASNSIKSSPSVKENKIDELTLEQEIKKAKNKLLSSLKGDPSVTDNPNFFDAVATLERLYQSKISIRSPKTSSAKKMKLSPSCRSSPLIEQHACIDGTWLMISPPTYPACVGVNSNGERMFTLGRMSFDMFQPADLICSIQKQYNTIRTVTTDEALPKYIPPSLRREAEQEHKKHCRGRLKAHK
jgi:hypothetical protein